MEFAAGGPAGMPAAAIYEFFAPQKLKAVKRHGCRPAAGTPLFPLLSANGG
jgi:hypothetical protein